MSDRTESGGILKTAARAVGAAAGKLAAVAKPHKSEAPKSEASALEPAETSKPSEKIGKLPARNKSRLPRKEKKARKKAVAAEFLKKSVKR